MTRTKVLGINCFLMGLLCGGIIFAILFLNSPRANASDLDLQTETLELESEEVVVENTDEEAELDRDLKEVESFFSEVDVPEAFKNSDIERTLKDGTKQKFDGDDFMIVPRKPKTDKPKRKVVRTIIVDKTKPMKKNRLTLYGGSGPNNLEPNSDFTRVELDRDLVIGVGYSRQVNERVNLDLIGISNETIMGGVGVSF